MPGSGCGNTAQETTLPYLQSKLTNRGIFYPSINERQFAVTGLTNSEFSSQISQKVVETLNLSGSDYEIIEIDPDFADTAEFCQKYGYPLENSGNTIIVASKKDPVQYSACLVKATDRLDVNNTVRKLMGVRKLSFATREQTIVLTGMEIGGVTPFALPENLPVYIDQKVMGLEYVILGSGVRSSKVKASPEILMKSPNTQLISGLSLISS